MEKNEGSREQVQSRKAPEPGNSKENCTDPPAKKPGSKAQGRKRTKSGCLTCRKRRIKCGEEKPTCLNCSKSKRNCEGYNQRVIFKDPLNTYRPPLSTPTQVSFITSILGQPGRDGDQNVRKATGKSHALAPRPTGTFAAAMRDSNMVAMPALPPASPGSERRFYNWSHGGSGPASPEGLSPKHLPPSDFDNIDRQWVPKPRKTFPVKEHVAHYDFNALKKTESGEMYPPTQITPVSWSAGPTATVSHQSSYPQAPVWMPPQTLFPMAQPYPPRHPTEPGKVLGVIETPESVQGQGFQVSRSRSHSEQRPPNQAPNLPQHNSGPGIQSPFQVFQTTPEGQSDLFDVSDSDTMMEEYESSDWQEDNQQDHLNRNDIGIVVAMHASQDNQGIALRTFTTHIETSDMLAHYIPSSQATPMRDPVTARIFCHFVNVTGPSMSIFERHPANPSLMFQGATVPRSQQHIWAYTFPTLALQNSALLHAMLALGSLHIAKLQGGPITASLKHYAIGLRRVAKSVSLPTRRGHPATLAAAMLLAFYECWSADHQKWSNHIFGAKQLVREIDFVGMTRYAKRKRAQHRQEEQMRLQQCQLHLPFDKRARFSSPPADEVDENLVGMLMGKKVIYDQYGQVMDSFVSEQDWNREYTERELETYETQRDLFWWYCKQDTYQSILGGGKLFMEYSLWSHCPPRAPIGRLDAVYGTFDHLILLMGRLAKFSAKDLKRKRLAMKASGGIWKPPGSMKAPTAPGQTPRPNTTSIYNQQSVSPLASPNTPPNFMPNFTGMVPGVKDAQLPMGFSASKSDPSSSPKSARSEDMDLNALTAAAEEEWQSIRNAFAILEDYFSPDFGPLGPGFSTPTETPFGPALQYRTYGIAGIWMNYYMGLIACHRCHPSMPPAAMIAAGICRAQTAHYANELGRIAAGLCPEASTTDGVSPGVGAVLIESSTCLFISGIQYTDFHQRRWTISRLRHIARLTGWQTALAIASGCEASWVKSGELGKTPPYTRMPPEEHLNRIPAHGGVEDWNHGRGRIFIMKSRSGLGNESTSNDEASPELGRQPSWDGRPVNNSNGAPDVEHFNRRIDRAFVGKSTEQRRAMLSATDRVHYALGVIGLEEDFEGLDIDGDGGI